MRLVLISDTHSLEHLMEHPIPDGDVLIHAGDMTDHGDPADVRDMVNYFNNKNLPHKHKIIIAGNHDFCFEKKDVRQNPIDTLEYHGWTYLEDSEVVIDGLKIYGSPYQP